MQHRFCNPCAMRSFCCCIDIYRWTTAGRGHFICLVTGTPSSLIPMGRQQTETNYINMFPSLSRSVIIKGLVPHVPHGATYTSHCMHCGITGRENPAAERERDKWEDGTWLQRLYCGDGGKALGPCLSLSPANLFEKFFVELDMFAPSPRLIKVKRLWLFLTWGDLNRNAILHKLTVII